MARTTLDGINQQTDWFDLRPARDAVNFMLSGTFNQAVSVQYSNDDDETKSNINTDATTYSTATLQGVVANVARFIRFTSGGAWGAGTTCVPTFAPTQARNGSKFIPRPQSIHQGGS